MKKISDKYTNDTFDNIKHIDDYGNEYWYARELSKVLEYKDWRNFLKVLNKAKEACRNSGFNIDEHCISPQDYYAGDPAEPTAVDGQRPEDIEKLMSGGYDTSDI